MTAKPREIPLIINNEALISIPNTTVSVSCSDGDILPIKTARDKFSNCETLRGKPKLFFIKACRGKKEDKGVPVMRDDASPSSIQPPSLCSDPPVARDRLSS